MKRLSNPYLPIGAILLAAVLLPLCYAIFVPHKIPVPVPVHLEIKRGDSLSRITSRLYSSKLIGSEWLFKWTVLASGNDKSFQTGRYRIERDMSVFDLIRLLKKGNPVLLEVTVPEGTKMADIFDLLNRAGFRNARRYRETVSHRRFVRSLGLPSGVEYLEGFLYPDTYKFADDVSERKIIETMVENFFSRIPANYAKQAEKIGLSFYKAVILASIIEKETSAEEERGLISSVFHNRLNINMRLQTDPTVIYGIKNFKGNLTRKQLRTPSKYNTYLNYGLPPTPIANPGLGSLLAAVRPAETDFLFFVAMGNGRHKFSVDYRSHLKAVRQYQKRRRKNYRSY